MDHKGVDIPPKALFISNGDPGRGLDTGQGEDTV